MHVGFAVAIGVDEFPDAIAIEGKNLFVADGNPAIKSTGLIRAIPPLLPKKSAAARSTKTKGVSKPFASLAKKWSWNIRPKVRR
jgi:hypothetical protein